MFLAVLALVASACGGSASGSQPTMTISSPADGATVHQPFTVHVDAGVPLGAPSTGDDHVHLCFDGGSCDTEYTLVYATRSASTVCRRGRTRSPRAFATRIIPTPVRRTRSR
jgi:hypothetical protein